MRLRCPFLGMVAAAAVMSASGGCAASDGEDLTRLPPPADRGVTTGPAAASHRPTDPQTSPQPSASPTATAAAGAGGTGAAARRPAWLGTRILPRRPDGFGEVRPTPEELRDRRLPTPDLLTPPTSDRFAATAGPVPPDVAARSTWREGCPVDIGDLRYVTATFWGFDGRPHTGELVVHASAADDLAEVFRRLYEARFPIEEMRVVRAEELDAPPTGDGNNTTAFVCRRTTAGRSWSQHAYGLAVDVNPFHNPYVKGDLVLPELASAYTDRGWVRPGMVVLGDEVTRAFAAIGWEWGGDWRTVKDWMHFSRTGR